MSNKTLLLTFSRSISLKHWLNTGLLSREKEIYEEHLRQGNFQKVFWLTYGGTEDQQILEKLKQEGQIHPEIYLVTKPSWWKFGNFLYSWIAPLIHLRHFRSVEYVKTNQMDGAWTAAIGKLLNPKASLIFRSGYDLIQFMKNDGKHFKAFFHTVMSSFVLKCSDYVIVTSETQKNSFQTEFLKTRAQIEVIGNYIDADLFSVRNQPGPGKRVVFLGRLEESKNVRNLIAACIETDFSLDLIGKGSQEMVYRSFAENSAKVSFLGVFPNDKLPEILSAYNFFIIPSLFEGNPKALLEAMALGMICLGTNVPGIKEVLIDGVNGIVIPSTSSEDIASTLLRVTNLSDEERKKISGNARDFIEQNHTLKAVAKKEKLLFGL